MPITDVYSDITNSKEVYFLNALNEPVKVKSIEKQPYKGKIYDVDVGNDIVLVRRGNDLNRETPTTSMIVFCVNGKTANTEKINIFS